MLEAAEDVELKLLAGTVKLEDEALAAAEDVELELLAGTIELEDEALAAAEEVELALLAGTVELDDDEAPDPAARAKRAPMTGPFALGLPMTLFR